MFIRILLWTFLASNARFLKSAQAWSSFLMPKKSCHTHKRKINCPRLRLTALSNDFLENDLVAVQKGAQAPRLCAVKPDGSVTPLCQRQDDVETDLFSDPREYSSKFWSDEVTDEDVAGRYGEGFYGQRPVPSLGGGPGYGAQADEIWSIDESTIDLLRKNGVELPVIDMGISHGEKARAGAF